MVYSEVINNPGAYDFSIQSLGPCTIDSPVRGRSFTNDDEQITFASQVKNIQHFIRSGGPFPAFQKAGPRSRIFHDPARSVAAIVTCGGLCPGLNNVIKGLVKVLHCDYGIKRIHGIRYGYQGLIEKYGHAPMALDPLVVDEIHHDGGTILGSSRGNQDIGAMADALARMGVNLFFCIGGDGTLTGAAVLADELIKRNAGVSVVGIPKTIDNDLSFMEKTFGFETAVHTAQAIITSAHNEAEGALNGVGIVKLMGRDSGFIASAATLANSVVDFCLVPEVPFSLEGPGGLFEALERRLAENAHAVIVVAEGAGQDLFGKCSSTRDCSGNVLKQDIGLLLKDEITRHFKSRGMDGTVKFLDPSYHIRSVPAIASDAIFCHLLSEHAVHAAMAGKTRLVIGHWNNYFTHVPIQLATYTRHKVDLDSALWKGVLEATRQNECLSGC